MNMVDKPDLKQILWHQMRGDLKSLVPWFADRELLLCPTCFRPLPFEDFSLEHIIPKQALKRDPLDVRQAISENERSGITLLCRRPLVIKGKRVRGHGCNSWKGKFYDPFVSELIHSSINKNNINSRHQIALFSIGYLGLFREFGYKVAISTDGLRMRNQFFHPNAFLRGIPSNCGMMLMGDALLNYSEDARKYWSVPFKIHFDGIKTYVVLRNICFILPLSRDPAQPVIRTLPYAPSRYVFRPDLTTVFDL